MEIKENNVQVQINEINQKLDLVLHYVNEQRLKSETIEDLVADVSIISKDAFSSAVEELDTNGIELNFEDIKLLGFKLLRNVNNFSQVMDMFESITDLLKDVGPIVNEVGIDFTHKLNYFEQKGYFEFFKEVANIMDNIISSYPPAEVRALSDNIITILDTVRNITQPDMLHAINNAISIFKNLDTNNIEEYSLWKAFREMNTPEMKRGIGFMITFLKNLSKEPNK
ncbi:MAG: DUF1641 domain-containing protein [Bacteroidales bacterium]|jgi:uncharacterized protein YjgD (DUF1641 family)/uncharacterized protein YfkK (UPF0435 family)|nr:DUF1641 domain-containing protein [Bacteroidales bacterium]